MRPCPNPPSKQVANDELVSVIQNGLALVEEADQRKSFSNLIELLKMPAMVDLKWILLVLSTITRGEHAYFAKDFIP